MNETPRIGMDQLSHFINLAKVYIDIAWQERFWDTVRSDCPELTQAIQAHFLGEMRTITFTRDLTSPAFNPDLVFGKDSQPQQRKQLPEQLEPEQESRI